MTEGQHQAAQELWRHASPTSTPMWKFLQHVNSKYGLDLDDYAGLYKWSIDNVAEFWEETWDFVGIKASKRFDKVLDPDSPMFPRPDFFEGALLNFAENLLFPSSGLGGAPPPSPSAAATITVTERTCDGPVVTSWAELREAVRRCANALRSAPGLDLRPGDVVAGFVSNHVQALAAMLAASIVGAIWTGISPDSGVSAVLDRLEQIGPKVLFADNASVYNGKVWDGRDKTARVVQRLKERGLRLVVVVENETDVGLGFQEIEALGVQAVEYEAFLASAGPEPLTFAQLPASHPLYILYSSGTTGLPKAIVHTAGGTLLQHKKELALHCSVGPSSRMLYYTTTSWMMWHWSVSALATGCSLVLYSGSPFRPAGQLSLPRLLERLEVTHFGTSAAYLTALEASGALLPPSDADPTADRPDLSRLEAIYSTASPLPPSTFAYVYAAFPARVHLASITGGTDIISLFGAPCPLLPVRAGEVQCAGLGMAIGVVVDVGEDEGGQEGPAILSAGSGETGQPSPPGDLVCTRPFPSQPLTFFGPGGEAKYRAAYFERFPAVAVAVGGRRKTRGPAGPIWHHGDFVQMRDAATGGGLVMLGRSDGVLKPAGVRFGSAEIYNVLARFFAAAVADAVCVGRRRPGDPDEAVCLFVVMAEGASFGDAVRKSIRDTVRGELTPRHVPAVVEECGPAGVPKTANGKKIEVAVKQILSGTDVKTNASVANPDALEWFREWAKAHP